MELSCTAILTKWKGILPSPALYTAFLMIFHLDGRIFMIATLELRSYWEVCSHALHQMEVELMVLIPLSPELHTASNILI